MAMKPMIPVPSSPMGALTRRRPILSLKPKVKRFDGGGLVERDVDVAPIDRDFSVDIAPGTGFAGSPEIGPARGDPTNPNNSSGLTAAQDAMAAPGLLDRLGDMLIGERSLSFDPVTGTFSTERDYAGAAGRAAVSSMFGPLGPVVSLGMRAGSKYGEPRDNLDPQGGSTMRNGGRVRLAAGGQPDVAAIIHAAMAGGGAPPGPQGQPGMPPGAPPAPPPEPSPLDFIPPAEELIRRYGPAAGAEAVAEAALAGGGRPGSGTRSGLLRGPGGGRSDAISAELEPDGFVYTAKRVKEKGRGSTERGAAKIAEEVGNPEIAEPIATVRGGSVPAKVSNGEVYLSRADAARAGGASALEADLRPRRRKGRRR